MKKFLLTLTLLVSSFVARAQCGDAPPGTQFVVCPQPPEGFCPYVEAFALTDVYTVQEPCSIGFPPASAGGYIYTAIRIIFSQMLGCEYEIQFTRSLSVPVWIAYARWTAAKDDFVLTDCPIYGCDPQRFFRVMVKPRAVEVPVITVRYHSRTTPKVSSRSLHRHAS